MAPLAQHGHFFNDTDGECIGADATRQTRHLPARSLDAFIAARLNPHEGVRLSANRLLQPRTGTRVVVNNGDFNLNERMPVAWWALSWEHKF